MPKTKVHPKAAADPVPVSTSCACTGSAAAPDEAEPPTVLTVWRKSLLFNCDGFTVYDARGDLAFRVDCYAAPRRRAEVVLMDAAGAPLLTVRRKRLSLAERWLIYDGADAGTTPPPQETTPPADARDLAYARRRNAVEVTYCMLLSPSWNRSPPGVNCDCWKPAAPGTSEHT